MIIDRTVTSVTHLCIDSTADGRTACSASTTNFITKVICRVGSLTVFFAECKVDDAPFEKCTEVTI